MALHLEISTVAGESIGANVTPEDHPLLVAERLMKRAIRNLVTPTAGILDERQTVLDANLQDGDVLHAVMMTEKELLSDIVQKFDDQLRLKDAYEKGDLKAVHRSGEYAIIEVEVMECGRKDSRLVHMLYHMPSWRKGSLLTTLMEKHLFCNPVGCGLVFVGDQEIEVREYKFSHARHEALSSVVSRMNLGTLLEEHKANSQEQIDLIGKGGSEGRQRQRSRLG